MAHDKANGVIEEEVLFKTTESYSCVVYWQKLVNGAWIEDVVYDTCDMNHKTLMAAIKCSDEMLERVRAGRAAGLPLQNRRCRIVAVRMRCEQMEVNHE